MAEFEMDAERAKEELIRVLELDPGMSWDEIVYYAAKAKGSLRMSNAPIQRRTRRWGLPELRPGQRP